MLQAGNERREYLRAGVLQVDARCITQQQSCGSASFVGHGVGRCTSKQDKASMSAGTHMLPMNY